MTMSVGYLLYLRISLKRPKISNLFALCDCFSPVYKRWSPRVGDGEKVQVKVWMEPLGKGKTTSVSWGLDEAPWIDDSPLQRPLPHSLGSGCAVGPLHWKKKMAQRLSPQPPNPHFQVAISPLKAAQHIIITRQTDKTPLVVCQKGVDMGKYFTEPL